MAGTANSATLHGEIVAYEYARTSTVGTCTGTLTNSDAPPACSVSRTELVPRIAGATQTRAKSTAVSTTNAAATAPKSTRKPRLVPPLTAAAARPAPTVARTRIEVHVAHLKTGRGVSRRGRSRRRPTTATTAPHSGPSTTAAKTQINEA